MLKIVWNEKRKSEIKRRVESGESAETVARKMALSVDAIRTEAYRQGLRFAGQKGFRWTPEEDALLIEMAVAGYDAQQISAAIPGRDNNMVYGRARTIMSQGIDLPIPKKNRDKVQNRSMADESSLGMISLRGLYLPLNRIAEAFE